MTRECNANAEPNGSHPWASPSPPCNSTNTGGSPGGGFHPRAAATHFLVTRSYVEQFGTIDEPGKFFHEGYPHEWVDDEAIGTAQYRKAYAYADDSIVEHMHPAWGKADWDDTYRRMGQRMRDGQTLFNRRRSLWT